MPRYVKKVVRSPVYGKPVIKRYVFNVNSVPVASLPASIGAYSVSGFGSIYNYRNSTSSGIYSDMDTAWTVFDFNGYTVNEFLLASIHPDANNTIHNNDSVSSQYLADMASYQFTRLYSVKIIFQPAISNYVVTPEMAHNYPGTNVLDKTWTVSTSQGSGTVLQPTQYVNSVPSTMVYPETASDFNVYWGSYRQDIERPFTDRAGSHYNPKSVMVGPHYRTYTELYNTYRIRHMRTSARKGYTVYNKISSSLPHTTSMEPFPDFSNDSNLIYSSGYIPTFTQPSSIVSGNSLRNYGLITSSGFELLVPGSFSMLSYLYEIYLEVKIAFKQKRVISQPLTFPSTTASTAAVSTAAVSTAAVSTAVIDDKDDKDVNEKDIKSPLNTE